MLSYDYRLTKRSRCSCLIFLISRIILAEQNRFDRRQYRTYTPRKIYQCEVLKASVMLDGDPKTDTHHEKPLRLGNTSLEFVDLLAYNKSVANLRSPTITLGRQ